jgi:hypothetical protein
MGPSKPPVKLKVYNINAPDGTPFEINRIERVVFDAAELKKSLGIRDDKNDFLERVAAYRRITHVKGSIDGQLFHGVRMQFKVYQAPASSLPRNDAFGGLADLLGALGPKQAVTALAWDLIDPVTDISRGVSLVHDPRGRGSWHIRRRLVSEHGISTMVR